MKLIGIDGIAFYTSHFFIDLATLASARGIDVNKFYVGLGQHKMAVPAPDEDIVTLGANAAKRLLRHTSLEEIDTLLFTTESGIDQSKAAGIYIHRLLGLSPNCRVVELKQACHSATSALHFAKALIATGDAKSVLLIASDVARYGLGSRGESSQGCGAVAMLIKEKPRILALEPGFGIYTEDVMDFWRPNYRNEAFVDGHYSTKMYMHALEEAWKHYQSKTKRTYQDHQHFCYHVPVPRLVEKAHQHLAVFNERKALSEAACHQEVEKSLRYGRDIGNCYTASLYLGFLSLLDHTTTDLSNQRVGFYSYGSGCVAEYFSGIIQPGYRQLLSPKWHNDMLKARKPLTYPDYEEMYAFQLPIDGSQCLTRSYPSGDFRLAGVERHQRIYEKI